MQFEYVVVKSKDNNEYYNMLLLLKLFTVGTS